MFLIMINHIDAFMQKSKLTVINLNVSSVSVMNSQVQTHKFQDTQSEKTKMIKCFFQVEISKRQQEEDEPAHSLLKIKTVKSF